MTKKNTKKPAASFKTPSFKTGAAALQSKAKLAADKAGEVVKANAQVAVATGKVLAAGLKEIGIANVADGRTAIATLSGDFKSLSQVKSAAVMVSQQRENTARNFKAISAAGKRNVTDLRALVSGKVAPLVQARIKANLELFRKAA